MQSALDTRVDSTEHWNASRWISAVTVDWTTERTIDGIVKSFIHSHSRCSTDNVLEVIRRVIFETVGLDFA